MWWLIFYDIIFAMKTKKCTKCQIEKAFDCFQVDNAKPHGLSSRCKECKKEYAARYYAAHPEKFKTLRIRSHDYRVAEYLRRRERMPWEVPLIGAQCRAKKKEIEFTLDREWGARTYTGRCSLSGVLLIPRIGGHGHHAQSPSIDRIDTKLGYVPENCRWVCVAVNCLRGACGDETMMMIANSLVEYQKSTPHLHVI